MLNFVMHYKPGRENEDADYPSRHPINCPAEDDDENSDTSLLCSIVANMTLVDRDERELTAKLKMIQILEEAGEHFKVDNPIDT